MKDYTTSIELGKKIAQVLKESEHSNNLSVTSKALQFADEIFCDWYQEKFMPYLYSQVSTDARK